MAGQVADYEITKIISGDGVLPVFQARRPGRLGGGDRAVSVWVLGPLSRTPWPVARDRLEPVAAVRAKQLPQWLEAGTGEWAQRLVIWVSADDVITGTLASAGQQMGPPARLRAVAGAARAAHALHESGQLHAAICPESVALAMSSDGQPAAVGGSYGAPAPSTGYVPAGFDPGSQPVPVLAPPSLANGSQPLAQVGYPPVGYVDPQLLRGEPGRWSDIWALGAVARYAVTGSCPFPGIEDLPVVRALAQLLEVPAPAPAEIPHPLSELVARCLARDPEARPATAEEVAAQLEEAAAAWPSQ